MSVFYITTAIDYANGSPHLGHAYEKVLTDVIARYRRLMGDKVHFLTGLDEHGQKIQQAAQAAGLDPKSYVDGVDLQFRDLLRTLDITNDDFIRTTEPRHQEVVQKILLDLLQKGEIYRGSYQGFYSVRAEQFVLEKEKVDGRWPEIYGEVVELTENNYFFRLSRHQDWLIQFLRENDFVFPRFRQKQVLEFLKEPLNDLCISRPRERLAWGIPLPFDPDYVCYVWFDALLNYISAVGYGTDRFPEYWPAAFNVIGKDILVPAHAVYWPIMLHAMGLPPPRSLLVHGWWHLAGQKLSKSTGVTVNPLDLVRQFGPDPFRYFVTREMNVGQDSDFSMDLFLNRYNSDLANDLGNLVSRLLNLASRHCPEGFSAPLREETPESSLRQQWAQTREGVLEDFAQFQFHTALEKTFAFVSSINRYAEVRAPWKLAKSTLEGDSDRLLTSLSVMAEALRLASALLAPVMPSTSSRILGLLGQTPVDNWAGLLEWDWKVVGAVPGSKEILFPRPGL